MPRPSPGKLHGPGIIGDGHRDVAHHPPKVFGQLTQRRDNRFPEAVRSGINHEPIVQPDTVRTPGSLTIATPHLTTDQRQMRMRGTALPDAQTGVSVGRLDNRVG